MIKMLLNVLGIILTSMGLSFIVLYLNLLVINYSFIDYIIFTLTHLSTFSFFIGIILLILANKTNVNKM